MTTDNITLLITIIGAIFIPLAIWLFSKLDNLKDKIHELELENKELRKDIEIQKQVTEIFKENTDIFITLISNTLNNNEKSSRLPKTNGTTRKNKQ